MQKSLTKWIDFQILGDERGSLVALEQDKAVPFDIKRVYYLYSTAAGVSRGYHAHRDLQQLAICISGRCRMILDDGNSREDALMDSPARGLFIDTMIWHEMHDFSPDCILLVIASDHYDEADYIRNYEEFLSKVRS